MWMDSVEAWEDGDALPVHKQLPLMILHLAHGTHTKFWKRGKVVPWLMSYLNRAIYWAESRPDLLQIEGYNAQTILDFFVEWRNALISAHLPPKAPVSFETVRDAAASVEVKHSLSTHLRNINGKLSKEPLGEIKAKRAKVTSKGMAVTLEKGKEWVIERFRSALRVATGEQEAKYVAIDKAEEAQSQCAAKFATNYEEFLRSFPEKQREKAEKAAAKAAGGGSSRTQKSRAKAPVDQGDITKAFGEVKTIGLSKLSLKQAKQINQRLNLGPLSCYVDGTKKRRRDYKIAELRVRIKVRNIGSAS
jgi:hypothetical protein